MNYLKFSILFLSFFHVNAVFSQTIRMTADSIILHGKVIDNDGDMNDGTRLFGSKPDGTADWVSPSQFSLDSASWRTNSGQKTNDINSEIYRLANIGIGKFANSNPLYKIDVLGGFSLDDGQSNIKLGYNAGVASIGANSIILGRSAGASNQAGNVTLIGTRAGINNMQPNTVSVGYEAGYNNNSIGSVNIGSRAGYQASGGTFNVNIGEEAGHGIVGYTNAVIGLRAGRNLIGNDNIGIGMDALKQANTSNTIAFGNNAGTSAQQNGNILIGNNAGQSSNATEVVAIGAYAAQNNTGPRGLFIGSSAGMNNAGPDNIGIGQNSMKSSTTGFDNIAIGRDAFTANQIGSRSVIVGTEAGIGNTTGGENTYIGWRAGFVNNGSRNTYVGESANDQSSNATGNTIMGAEVMHDSRDGSYNVAVGESALYLSQTFDVVPATNLTIGDTYEVFLIGTTDFTQFGAANNNKFTQFVYTGNPTNGDGRVRCITKKSNGNVALGHAAGYYVGEGSNNIFLGSKSGFSPTFRNINNRLIIGNTEGTNTPIIDGDMDSKELGINGVLQLRKQYPITGIGVSNGSMFYGTDGALYFKGGSGTVTMIAPN